MYTYKIVISIHGHLNTDARELCTEHCHFSFGIYLETNRIANEMQGRLSTLPPKKSAYSRLSLYAAYYDGYCFKFSSIHQSLLVMRFTRFDSFTIIYKKDVTL